MKLLVIAAQYPLHEYESGGVFVREQVKVLARRHAVTVLAPRLLTPRAWLRPSASAPGAPCRDEGVATIPVRIPNLTNRWPWLTFRCWRRAMIRAGLRHCAQNGAPDIVHAHFSRPAGMTALAIARRIGATAVLTEHSGPFSTQIDGPFHRRETREVMCEMDAIAAVSPSLRAAIRKEFPGTPVEVLGNVVDESRFIPALRPSGEPPSFLFVGGLVPEKGVSDLIEASALLKTISNREWRVKIAGAGPLRTGLEAQVRAAGLQDRVDFLGPLCREEVADHMRRATAFVLPSRGESFGVVVIEAMACGVPVIATRCGGPEWIVEADSGFLVPVGSPREIAQAMSRLLLGNHGFAADKIRSNVVARFGRDTWLEACEQFYALAVRRRRVRSSHDPA